MGSFHPTAGASRDDDQASCLALPADLVRALDWLRSHDHERVDLETLAIVAGVRPRTLEAHFRQFLGTTPIGWQRRMRLARARQQLLDADRGSSVTDIALANGFNQLGRFADEYRRRYDELPSRTLRRSRRSTIERDGDLIDDEAIRLTWDAFPAAFAVASRGCSVALERLDRALERAPRYGLAKALAAWCWGQRAAQNFSTTPEEDLARACALAVEAEALAPDDPVTLALAGGAFTLAHRLEEADLWVERALALDPCSAVVWMRRGWLSAYLGDSDGALGALKTTFHLAPVEPLRHLTLIGIGCVHFFAERYERALAWTRDGIEGNPHSFWAERIVIASAVHYGARAEARRLGYRLMRKDRSLTVARAMKAWPFRPSFMHRLGDGLEKAGIPRA